MWFGREGRIGWSVGGDTYLSVLAPRGQAVQVPYQSHDLWVDITGIADDRLRVAASVGFFHDTASAWYGLGNAATAQVLPDADLSGFSMEHLSPWADVLGRIRLADPPGGRLELAVGLAGSWNRISSEAGSRLHADEAEGALAGFSVDPAGVASVKAGLVWDSRDEEDDPGRGGFHELTVRGGASGLGTARPGAFGGVNLTVTRYWPLWRDRLVVATRGMADVGWGRTPLHELSASGGLASDSATGGGSSIRGVWSGRRAGRVKVLSNLELRARMGSFSLFGLKVKVGGVGFTDAGRVWAELRPDPSLDGARVGLATGVGGGIRVGLGDELMIRVDGAWSPSDRTSGVYIDLGHAF